MDDSKVGKGQIPTVFFMASLLIRMFILLCGFYLLKDGSYFNLPLALLGVFLVRIVMVSNAKKVAAHANRNDDGEG